MARPRKLFVNLPVRDLQRSIDFFTDLGFAFDLRFTDDRATCMIVSEEAFVMLVTEERFHDFTKKPICDTPTRTEGIFAVSSESRKEVDAFADKALAAGASEAMPPFMNDFMYQRSFYDLDGHHWEVFHMEPAAFAK